MLRRKSRLLPVILAVVVLAAAALAVVRHGAVRTVEVARPSRGEAVAAIYATGVVEPVYWAKIAPVVPGRLAEILVDEGDRVTAGQPLARLDDREARARVSELEAKAAYWRAEMTRAQALAERGIRSRGDEEKARSEYNQVTAAIAAARQRRTDLVVTSPIDGTVLRRDGEVGEVMSSDDAIFWVGTPRPLRVTADVDEEDIARVQSGQRVLIKADAFAGQVLEGTVGRITPKGDPVNKTFRVRVDLPDDTPLRVGMTTEVNIVVEAKKDAMLLPSGAVGEDFVLLDDNGVVRRQPVKPGIRARTATEVVGGLAGDEAVIVNPPADLKPGDRVRAK